MPLQIIAIYLGAAAVYTWLAYAVARRATTVALIALWVMSAVLCTAISLVRVPAFASVVAGAPVSRALLLYAGLGLFLWLCAFGADTLLVYRHRRAPRLTLKLAAQAVAAFCAGLLVWGVVVLSLGDPIRFIGAP